MPNIYISINCKLERYTKHTNVIEGIARVKVLTL